jgi:hypothetical protein
MNIIPGDMHDSGRQLIQHAGAEGPIRSRAPEIYAVGSYRIEHRRFLNNEVKIKEAT